MEYVVRYVAGKDVEFGVIEHHYELRKAPGRPKSANDKTRLASLCNR